MKAKLSFTKAQALGAASSWRAFCDIERRGQRPRWI